MQQTAYHIFKVFAVVTLLVGMVTPGFAASPDIAAAEQILQLAAADDCGARCEQNKKSCFSQYTFTNSFGVKGVTPEGTRICWEGYRECMKNCKK